MLPLALIDLTLSQSRLIRHISPIKQTSLVKSFERSSHAVAVQTSRVAYPGPPIVPKDTTIAPQRRSKANMEKSPLSSSLVGLRAHPAALVRNLVHELVESSPDESGMLEGPILNEDDLQQIYADLLAEPFHEHDRPLAINHSPSEFSYKSVLEEAARRLQLFQVPNGGGVFEAGLANKLYALRGQNGDGSTHDVGQAAPDDEGATEPIHRALLKRVEQYSDGLGTKFETSNRAPVFFLSSVEWEALVNECVAYADFNCAEQVLSLMRTLKIDVLESISDVILKAYASAGDVEATTAFLLRFYDEMLSELSRDRLVRAHLNSMSPEYNVGTALQVIHDLENRGLNPPMKTYTRVIVALTHKGTSISRAQAWDLFAHMRYVAHPQPDEFLYTYMIRACGYGPSQSAMWVQPERALDLWHEMRSSLGEGVLPSVKAYNAIIFVCARSRKFSGEAFRLAREMLDAHRDAFGRPLLRPTRHTFGALLTAAKTRGDLSRTRWILAEMLSLGSRKESIGDTPEAELVDEPIMMHVLHAYSAYKPPFNRSLTREYDEKDIQITEETPSESVDADISKVVTTETRTLSAIPPQTAGETLFEARLLFERIIEDSVRNPDGIIQEMSHSSTGHFRNVKLTSRLANCYMSVVCQHGLIDEVRRLFYGTSTDRSVYERMGVARGMRSYVEAMERCSYPRDHSERRAALDFAELLWSDVQRLMRKDSDFSSVTEAQWIERGWAAMMRVLATNDQLDRAMGLLRDFTNKFHPNLVHSAPSHLTQNTQALTTSSPFTSSPSSLPKAMLSTRVSLYANRPLVRLTSPVDNISTKSGLADSAPPLLSFSDVELLHHKLVCEGGKRRKDIAFLKWVCSAYKGALKKRWQESLSARTSGSENDPSDE